MRFLLLISVAWFVSEMGLARLARASASSRIEDRSSLRFLWITITVAIPLGIFLGGRWGNAMIQGSRILYLAGNAGILLGLTLRWAAILTLRKAFTVNVAVNPSQRLVRHGVYRLVRHPSYTGALLSFLRLSLSFNRWLTLVLIFLPILLVFLYRIRIEEDLLRENFGEEYRDYSQNTTRLIPWIY